MSAEKPTAEQRLASTKPGCTCSLCAMYAGDQTSDPLEHEVDRLKAELRAMHSAVIGAAADIIRLTQPESVEEHPRYTLLDREQIVPRLLTLKRDIDAIRARSKR